ncbi:dynein regulatory complex protein 9-like [Aulostomus maculatus]
MSLSHIQSLRLAAVLEDCSDQLDIVGHSLTVQGCRAAGVQEKARVKKLKRDCQYISQQVSKLHAQLEGKQSFTCLLQVVAREDQRKNDEQVQRETKRERERKKLTLQRQQEELQQKSERLKDMQRIVKDLRLEMSEQPSKADKKKLVDLNIEMQLRKTQKEMSQAEMLLQDQHELLKEQLKQEVRLHEECKKFRRNQYEELQQQLRQWKQRTQLLQQDKQQQLNNARCKRTVNLDKLMEMRRKCREMEELVIEDREEQEILHQKQEEARAATKVQAWWRGCMVRRGIGSFKKEVDDKNGKKKRKKEGKQKKK